MGGGEEVEILNGIIYKAIKIKKKIMFHIDRDLEKECVVLHPLVGKYTFFPLCLLKSKCLLLLIFNTRV